MGTQIDLRNKTPWQSRGLRSLFMRGIRAEGDGRRRHWTIEVRNARSRRFSGYAWLDTSSMVLIVPTPKILGGDQMSADCVRRLARVFGHELGHCLGLTHRRDRPWRRPRRKMSETLQNCDQPVPWAQGVKILRKGAGSRERPARDLVAERYARALKRARKHETALKRTKTLLAKARREVRYYERTYSEDRIAASPRR